MPKTVPLGGFLAGHGGVPGVGFSRRDSSKQAQGRSHGEGAGQGPAFGEKHGDGGRRPVDRPRHPRAGGAQPGRARGGRGLRPPGRRSGLGDPPCRRPRAGRLHDARHGRHRARQAAARAAGLRARADGDGDGARRSQGALCRGRRARVPGALPQPAHAAPAAARAGRPPAAARAHGRGRDARGARAREGDPPQARAGGGVPRRGDRLPPDPHVALFTADRQRARPRARRGRDGRAGRAAARHRQDRHPRPDPAQARQARRARMGRDAAPSGHRARDSEGQRVEVRAHGRADRARPPREIRRLGLSQRPGRRPHPSLRAHRRRGGRLRRAHLGAPLQEGLVERAGPGIRREPGRPAFRPAPGRSLLWHEEGSAADPERMARPPATALTPDWRGALVRLRARFAARPDTEHEQAIVRLAIGTLIGLYLLPGAIAHQQPIAFVMFGYLVTAALLFIHILAAPSGSPTRRVIGALADIGTLTACMAFLGERAAPLFLVYIWVTLANGFRFGQRYLLLSLGLSVAGFLLVIWQNEYWREHRVFGYGLLLGLILLSLYVRSLVTKLFDALARAEAANLAKRRFISVVSHEMRTPLNAIIGMADLMRDTSLSREQADMLQTLRSSSRVMLGLVDDVLDFSKIEAGKLVLEKADFDLHALVNSTSRILSAQAAARGLDFVVSIMPEVPPALRGDPTQLRQILINQAGKAVKFTEHGSVTVHVSAQAESETDVRLKFSIRDTGIGIPPEAQAKIFESFTQADQSTTRRFGGTGLGTTIAKQLVGLMGGKIGLESSVGLGTTFWVEIDLEKQPERTGIATGELADARILLVGLPPAQREAFAQALSGWGAGAFTVENVDEAASWLTAEISRAKPYHSAIIFGGGGHLKDAQRFRRTAPTPPPPAILAAPREAAVQRFEALSAGFAAVLELPFDKRQLFNVLHSVSAGEPIHEGVVHLRDYAQRGRAGARKLRVLVADDNPTNREVLGKILERAGHAVTLVDNGEHVLDTIERERNDLVILDRNMPGMSGPETLRALRLLTRGSERLPVIMLSADVTPEAKREALEAGADAYLSKPIEALRLLDEIRALAGVKPEPARRPQPAAHAPAAAPNVPAVVNPETLAHLEQLGSSPAFLERLIGVFLTDFSSILGRVERALAARNFGEFRSLLHAIKGSSASMGTDRLTQLCDSLGGLSDAELRLQAPGTVRALNEEFLAVRDALQRHLQERQRSAS